MRLIIFILFYSISVLSYAMTYQFKANEYYVLAMHGTKLDKMLGRKDFPHDEYKIIGLAIPSKLEITYYNTETDDYGAKLTLATTSFVWSGKLHHDELKLNNVSDDSEIIPGNKSIVPIVTDESTTPFTLTLTPRDHALILGFNEDIAINE